MGWPKAGTLVVQSSAPEPGSRDLECPLSGREGAHAGAQSQDVPTRESRAHLDTHTLGSGISSFKWVGLSSALKLHTEKGTGNT